MIHSPIHCLHGPSILWSQVVHWTVLAIYNTDIFFYKKHVWIVFCFVAPRQGGGGGPPIHPSGVRMQARTPPASTMKCTRPAINKEHTLRTRDPQSGGAYVVDGRDNAWRSRAPGPHAHANAARQVVDGLRTEVCGQQKQSKDPHNNQHNPSTPTIAPLTRKRHILPHPAQPSTPTTGLRKHGNDTSRSTGRSGRQKAATRRNMRREEWENG